MFPFIFLTELDRKPLTIIYLHISLISAVKPKQFYVSRISRNRHFLYSPNLNSPFYLINRRGDSWLKFTLKFLHGTVTGWAPVTVTVLTCMKTFFAKPPVHWFLCTKILSFLSTPESFSKFSIYYNRWKEWILKSKIIFNNLHYFHNNLFLDIIISSSSAPRLLL